MLVHKREYLDWWRGKKARGQMIAALPAHIRYIHTEALRGQRNLIRKRLGQDHNTAYHRFMIFDQLKHLSYERIILKTLPAGKSGCGEDCSLPGSLGSMLVIETREQSRYGLRSRRAR